MQIRNIKRIAAVSVTAAGLTLAVAPSAWATSTTTSPTSGTSSDQWLFQTVGMTCPNATNQPNGDKLDSFVVDNAQIPAADLGQMTFNVGVTTWSWSGNSSYSSQGLLDTGGGTSTTPYYNAATQQPTPTQGTAGSWGADTQGPFTYSSSAANDYASTQAAAQAAQDDFYPGTFNVGIACVTPSGTIDGDALDYVQQTFTDTSNANGPSFAWTDAAMASQTPEFPYAVVLPLGGLGILGAGVFLMRRRKGSAPAAA